MTSSDVIGLLPFTISLVKLYNCFWLWKTILKHTRNIRLSVTIQTLWEEDICHNYIAPPLTLGGCAITFSPVKQHFSPLKVFTGLNFEARRLRFFFILELIYTSIIPRCFLFFSIRKFRAPSVNFFHKMSKFLNVFENELNIWNINNKEL